MRGSAPARLRVRQRGPGGESCTEIRLIARSRSDPRPVGLARGRFTVPEAFHDPEAALHLTRLPELHRDPFDRMLVCQALVGGMVVLSPDPMLTQYPVRALW